MYQIIKKSEPCIKYGKESHWYVPTSGLGQIDGPYCNDELDSSYNERFVRYICVKVDE